LYRFPKVTRNLGIALLALLVVALGIAAKHGQFDSRHQQGQFLAKAVKMECGQADRAPEFAIPACPLLLTLEIDTLQPVTDPPQLIASVVPFHYTPLLV
jgi:hypothetical protein